MRTIVNTTKRTTYVVTDHDIIEALASLGIPRSVLLSEDTTFKACENVRAEEGFDFCGAGDAATSSFLTVEAPAEESEASVDPAPESKPDVYPNGTVLIGTYTDTEYVVRGYDPMTDVYDLWGKDEQRTFNSYRTVAHNGRVYRVKPDVYPNGTVLIGQYSGVAYTIRGYNPATSTYTVWSEQDQDSFQSPREATHNERFYRVKPAPTPTPAPEPDRFPVGTILRYCDNEYFVVGYVAPPERFSEGYRLWSINNKREEWEEYLVSHNPKSYTVVHRPTPGAPTPGGGAPADPFPVGTVLRNVGGFVSCITGYGPNDWYTTCTDLWGTGCDVDRVLRSSRYTVLYRPPSKA